MANLLQKFSFLSVSTSASTLFLLDPHQLFFQPQLLLLLSCFSCVRLCATPETAAHQAPPSLGFSSRTLEWVAIAFSIQPQYSSEISFVKVIKGVMICPVVNISPHFTQSLCNITRWMRPLSRGRKFSWFANIILFWIFSSWPSNLSQYMSFIYSFFLKMWTPLFPKT